jgi:hypothetical protein
MAKAANKDFVQDEKELFENIRSEFLNYDPAQFTKNKLMLDKTPFNVIDNGWRFMADIYRYIALQATTPNGKPVVICKGRQVGATVMAGALDLYFTNSGLFQNPPIRVAHLFPQAALVKRFSQDKLESLITDAKDDFINRNKLKTANAVDNLTYKQFKTGSLWVESLGKDGDRIRGMTIDVMFFDEIQDMVGSAIGNAVKTLTAAKYGPVGKGVQVYFGTPKERGSYFHKIWEMSDKRYFHLGCTNCNRTFPFYQSGSDEWRKIWLYEHIIQCIYCGAKQTKIDAINNGKWIPSVDPDEAKFVGFHINQLYHPSLSKEHIMDLMPEYNPNQSERLWNNEVVGEFYSGAGLPLTKTELMENCMDFDRAFSKKIDPKEKQTYLGIDWGEKVDVDGIERGQSFSCAVVISVQPDGTIYVEHAHKLRQNNPSYKRDTVAELFKRFGIKQGVADFFYGQDIVREMQSVFHDKFLGAQGSGQLLKPLRYREDELIISYNKDLLIDEMFSLFRKGRIRFPWKSYEHVEWLLDHASSMEIDVKMVNGQTIKTYKKGSIPNDGLMALMYAFVAYKFDITKGFQIKPGIDRQHTMPKPELAYIPRLR